MVLASSMDASSQMVGLTPPSWHIVAVWGRPAPSPEATVGEEVLSPKILRGKLFVHMLSSGVQQGLYARTERLEAARNCSDSLDAFAFPKNLTICRSSLAGRPGRQRQRVSAPAC